MIHIDTGYKLAPQPKSTSDEKILKITRLLFDSFHLELRPWHWHNEDPFLLLKCSCVAPTSPPC